MSCFPWFMCSEFRRQAFRALVFSFLLASCTVKERREACPCRLTLILGNVPSPPATVLVSGEGFRRSFRADSCLSVLVPRSGVQVVALAGAPIGGGESLTIPEGEESPPVYLASALVPAGRDTVTLALTLHKAFCRLSLEVEGPPGWGEPYGTRVRGAVNGIGLDGKPSRGAFSCRLDPGSAVCLPRQDAADPLWLDITMSDGVVRTFSLGNLLEAGGYDWAAPDLADAEICLQLSVTALTLGTEGMSPDIFLHYEI